MTITVHTTISTLTIPIIKSILSMMVVEVSQSAQLPKTGRYSSSFNNRKTMMSQMMRIAVSKSSRWHRSKKEWCKMRKVKRLKKETSRKAILKSTLKKPQQL